MIEIGIVISFGVLLVLLSIKFGFVTFLGTFTSVIFLMGFIYVIASYFYHTPKIEFKFQAVQKHPGFNDLYDMNFIINDTSRSTHDYNEVTLIYEPGTLSTTDAGAEIIRAYALNENMHWPYTDGSRIPLNEFRNAGNKSLVHTFPLLVNKETKQTHISVILDLHRNPYESGIAAIFNPLYK